MFWKDEKKRRKKKIKPSVIINFVKIDEKKIGIENVLGAVRSILIFNLIAIYYRKSTSFLSSFWWIDFKLDNG